MGVNAYPIGIIGLGLVGTAIAERLLEAGEAVCGFDLKPERCDHLRACGGAIAASPAELAKQTRLLVLAVFDDGDIERALWGEQGVMYATARPEVIVSTTTSDPERVVATARRASAEGVPILDATISGTSVQVRKRDSVMMIGGDAKAVALATHLFEIVAKQWFHVGDAGAGARAKLVINLVLGLNRAALGEGLAFAERLGLDTNALMGVLKASAAYSQVMDTKGDKMLKRDYTVQGRLSQHAKDVTLILAQAKRLGMHLPMSTLHDALLQQAIADGDGEIDNSAVVEVIRRQSIVPGKRI
jgi:3-hydroxyisobutyrate dehydrogenase-like beta-hydroxyacid dehydrogenase